MSHNHPSSAVELRAAAMRMIAATEHFKASGDLPTWARADLESWNRSDAAAAARRARLFALSA
jgi:hypothetical protein